MSSKTQVNCRDFPPLAQANLQRKVREEAKRQFALRKGHEQSKAAAKARNIAAFQSLPPDQQTWSGAVQAFLSKAPAKAPAKDPDPAPAKAPAPAPTKSTWTKVRAKKKKPKKKPKAQPKRAWLPRDQYIASLKRQVEVLKQRMAKAKRDNKPEDAESFQRQINTRWGKMKRAEHSQRKSACRRWNAQQRRTATQHGHTGTLADHIVRK